MELCTETLPDKINRTACCEFDERNDDASPVLDPIRLNKTQLAITVRSNRALTMCFFLIIIALSSLAYRLNSYLPVHS